MPYKRALTVEEANRRAQKRTQRADLHRKEGQTAIAKARGLTYEEYRLRIDQMRERRAAGKSGSEADRHREYRASVNGKEAVKRAGRMQRERRQALMAQVKNNPCADCGGKFHSQAMEFDHRDPAEKSFSICLLRGISKELLESEIAKCDLVCANCHRVRHVRRREGLPPTLPPPEYHI